MYVDINKLPKAKVFISYSWDNKEHKKKVKDFADSLKSTNLFDVLFDEHINHAPNEGWISWMEIGIKSSDFVFLICNKNYIDIFNDAKYEQESDKNKGVKFEIKLIRQEIYNHNKNISAFVPIFLKNIDTKHHPELIDSSSYNLAKDEFEKLCVNIQAYWEQKKGFESSINNFQDNENYKPYINTVNQEALDLFNQKKYSYAKKHFYKFIDDNDINLMYYIVASLSDTKDIYILKEKVITNLYNMIDNLSKGKYSDIANYLWLIIYYEHTKRHSDQNNLSNQVLTRQAKANLYELNEDEKKLIQNIDYITKDTKDLFLWNNIINDIKNDDKFFYSGKKSQLEDYECFDDPANDRLEWEDGKKLKEMDNKEKKSRWRFFYRPYNFGNIIGEDQRSSIIKERAQIEVCKEKINKNDRIIISSFFITALMLAILPFGYIKYLLLTMILTVIYHSFDSNKLKVMISEKKYIISILEKEIKHLMNQYYQLQANVLKPKEIENQFKTDIANLEEYYIEKILGKDKEQVRKKIRKFKSQSRSNFEKKDDNLNTIYPVITSWALLQSSKQKSYNGTTPRYSGINLAYKDIGKNIATWRKIGKDKPFFRLWYLQFLLFDDKNLTLVTVYYDFVTKKRYNERIELYQYNHITNYSFINEDITSLEEDPILKTIPDKFKSAIFNQEYKTISLESSSGSYYRCVIPDHTIYDNFDNWLTYKENLKDDIKKLKDFVQTNDNKKYIEDLKKEFYKNKNHHNNKIETTAWLVFKEIRSKVSKFAVAE